MKHYKGDFNQAFVMSTQDKEIYQASYESIHKGDYQTLEALVDKLSSLDKSEKLYSLLSIAIKTNQPPSTIKSLIDAGAQPNKGMFELLLRRNASHNT